jgi:hypothetical protein
MNTQIYSTNSMRNLEVRTICLRTRDSNEQLIYRDKDG